MRTQRPQQVQVDVRLPDIDGRFAALAQRMDDYRDVQLPPDGFRWKVRAEYATEYVDAATTPGRRQQLLAIRCGLLPRETVAV